MGRYMYIRGDTCYGVQLPVKNDAEFGDGENDVKVFNTLVRVYKHI